ncbi:uncharacterized protein BCR38DRAFT_109822 [Pseudomassariella vexata]|uniref:Uncharacterized protein n=1 Tax=Pseudomassariella vexata TaxID=1141098 RepID=A0A1Y2DD87_9PEZI|nr:uncharacterized protein BCR38DRAFT_109822 [Pseudomassariella vexata]ORY57230.1 hypothetical protein BCR38DRAFT_109822 [Pseudomassariella vexata]
MVHFSMHNGSHCHAVPHILPSRREEHIPTPRLPNLKFSEANPPLPTGRCPLHIHLPGRGWRPFLLD